MADFADRSLGIGYTGGSALLLVCLIAVLVLWYWSQGTISVNTVSTPKVEGFYWAAITFSQTLGTAVGDWAAKIGGLGYEGGTLVFAAGLAVIAGLYFWTNVSRVVLFWATPRCIEPGHRWIMSGARIADEHRTFSMLRRGFRKTSILQEFIEYFLKPLDWSAFLNFH